MARVAPEDRFAGLADQANGWPTTFPDLDLLDATIPSATELTEMALAAEDAARAVPGVTNSGGASAGWSLGGLVLATSRRLRRLVPRLAASACRPRRSPAPAPAWSATTTTRARSTAPTSATRPRSAGRPASAPSAASTRARFRPAAPPSSTIRASPPASSATSPAPSTAPSIARKTSFLRDKLGQQIFSAVDPHHRRPDAPARPRLAALRRRGRRRRSRSMSSRTACCRPGSSIRRPARELGLETNGRASRGGGNPSPGSTNLTLLPGDQSPEEMIRDIGSGLYVTELIGHGASIVTGDYSRGAAGFVIENGELGHPVSEITIAGNLADMFRELRAGQRSRLPLLGQRADGCRARPDRRRELDRRSGACGARPFDAPSDGHADEASVEP